MQLGYGDIKISLMGVIGGHFVGMDPPEWADMLVVCSSGCGVWAWSDLPHPPNFA